MKILIEFQVALKLNHDMATRVDRFYGDIDFPGDRGRLYTACFFERGDTVPRVQFLAAANDEEAIADLKSSHIFTTRELWDRHRLIAVIPADATGRHVPAAWN